MLAELSAIVEWVPVCPELEVGMGVPREPIQLVAGASGAVRLEGVHSQSDWTARMQSWASRRIDELRRLRLSGFVLKARSPSCGVRDVPVRGADDGSGMFAQALVTAMPDLPVEDENGLRDARIRAEFLARVRAHHAAVTDRNNTPGHGDQPEEDS